MAEKRFIVVGGGLAGLAAVVALCEKGHKVDVFSIVPVKRSHSVCAQGGINGCVDPDREGDTTYQHFYDTVYGGDFLANQPPVRYMTEDAPQIIALMTRAGVPFNRTPEGNVDFRAFGGAKFKRTAYAAGSTGQQLLYSLDEQVRRYEAAGMVRKFEYWEMLALVKDGDGRCVGIVAMDLHAMEIHAFRGEATILATGGPGLLFGKSTMSTICTGAASARAYKAGAHYANGEFIQVHPSAIPGADKLRLMSESIRGEGGRIWVPKKQGDDRKPVDIPEDERLYFLEEKYPAYGNLVPRDIATRDIFDICVNQGMGVGGRREVYLDITHLVKEHGAEWVNKKIGNLMHTYQKFVGEDPLTTPLRIFPGVHYSMGGLWVDYETDPASPVSIGRIKRDSDRNGATTIPGLFAAGECDYQYHGANRLGANSLLSCIHTGLRMAGPSAAVYAANQEKSADAAEQTLFDGAVKAAEERLQNALTASGDENPYAIWKELGEAMTGACTVVRSNEGLKKLDGELDAFGDRLNKVGAPDGLKWTNQSAAFTMALQDMLDLARVVVRGAIARDESRGAHYKEASSADAKKLGDDKVHVADDGRSAFTRNDEDWLKSTIATYDEKDGAPAFTFEPVDVSIAEPILRDYTKVVKATK